VQSTEGTATCDSCCSVSALYSATIAAVTTASAANASTSTSTAVVVIATRTTAGANTTDVSHKHFFLLVLSPPL
jgi:hypothetical protein